MALWAYTAYEALTASASLYIDLAEHGGGSVSGEDNNNADRIAASSDFRGRNLIFFV